MLQCGAYKAILMIFPRTLCSSLLFLCVCVCACEGGCFHLNLDSLFSVPGRDESLRSFTAWQTVTGLKVSVFSVRVPFHLLNKSGFALLFRN